MTKLLTLNIKQLCTLFTISTLFSTLFPTLFPTLCAQNPYTLTASDTFQNVRNIYVLADKNYTFEQVSTDSTLPFRTNDTLNVPQTTAYWLKAVVNNPFAYAEKYMVGCFPWVDYTVYYYDENQKKWLNHRNGFGVASYTRRWSSSPILIQGRKETILYFRINMTPLSHLKSPLRAGVSLHKANISDRKVQFSDTTTALTICLVAMFFLFNAYIYYIFRDKTYFYYLIIQLGGIAYILTTNSYLNVFLPFRLNRFYSSTHIFFAFWDLNNFVNDLSIIVLLAGFIQLTRAYLNTRTALPTQDKILKYLLYTYIVVVGTMTFVTAANIKYLAFETPYVVNILTIFIMGTIFYTTFLSYRQGYKPARYFFFSNFISLLIIAILAIYYLLADPFSSNNILQLPNIAIVAQAFCLAIALVERFLLIKDELRKRELEAQELAAQNKRIAAENHWHKTELENYTQLLREKTEAFDKLKTDVDTQQNHAIRQDWHNQITQASILTDEQWRNFKFKFENVHIDFFNRLQYEIPTVTEAEKRLLALTKLEMSNNEIASMLGISPESVTKTRYRLRKKVGEEVLDLLMERL